MTIRELIDSVSLKDYVEQYAEFEKRGNEYWCCSPLNQKDTDPSFSVNVEDNVFYDFSSHKSGNIINFIISKDRCTFGEAIQKIKDFAGIKDEIINATSIQIVKTLKSFKPKNCKEKSSRQVLDESVLNQYIVDTFPWWEDEGISSDTAIRWGCGYDPYWQCITIPVRDSRGNLVNILQRTMRPDAKVLGIPKYIYKNKLGTLDFLWGWSENIHNILKKGKVIIFEGAKSVMKVSQWGYDNAAAILTSNICDDQVKLLVSHSVDCYFMFDKDIKNPERDSNIKKLRMFNRVYICKDRSNLLMEKESPCDRGKDVFEKILNEGAVRI